MYVRYEVKNQILCRNYFGTMYGGPDYLAGYFTHKSRRGMEWWCTYAVNECCWMVPGTVDPLAD